MVLWMSFLVVAYIYFDARLYLLLLRAFLISLFSILFILFTILYISLEISFNRKMIFNDNLKNDSL